MSGVRISVSQGAVMPGFSLSQAGVMGFDVTQIESLAFIIEQGTSISPAATLTTNPLGADVNASWTFVGGAWVEYALPDTATAWGYENGGAILLEDGQGRLLMES
jgi:hypothetical protein